MVARKCHLVITALFMCLVSCKADGPQVVLSDLAHSSSVVKPNSDPVAAHGDVNVTPQPTTTSSNPTVNSAVKDRPSILPPSTVKPDPDPKPISPSTVKPDPDPKPISPSTVKPDPDPTPLAVKAVTTDIPVPSPTTIKPDPDPTSKPTTTAKPDTTTKPTEPTTSKATSTEKPSTTSAPTTSSTETPTASTTTVPPSPSPTTKPPVTTSKPNVTTAVPVTTAAPAPHHNRQFDGPSFIGGIVLASGLMAIGFVAFKFYRARTERNYHTL